MGYGKIAADFHADMCNHPGFGYSWAERWGGPNVTTFESEGHRAVFNVGDYDCSSSVITAWSKALEGTPYEGALDGATYTGNMRSVFVGSGLFDWVDVSEAEPGDLYLNEANHVAMCQPGGMLSEFSSSETGGIYGERGDQTGWESHITDYYWYPWDGCLKYNGKADDDMIAPDVWNYGLKSFKGIVMSAGDRLVDIQKFFYDLTDYSGRGKDGSNFIQRICWMAAKQEKQNDLLVAIAVKVGIPEEEARKMLEVEPPEEAKGDE